MVPSTASRSSSKEGPAVNGALIVLELAGDLSVRSGTAIVCELNGIFWNFSTRVAEKHHVPRKTPKRKLTKDTYTYA